VVPRGPGPPPSWRWLPPGRASRGRWCARRRRERSHRRASGRNARGGSCFTVLGLELGGDPCLDLGDGRPFCALILLDVLHPKRFVHLGIVECLVVVRPGPEPFAGGRVVAPVGRGGVS